jgi:hypothetical protein
MVRGSGSGSVVVVVVALCSACMADGMMAHGHTCSHTTPPCNLQHFPPPFWHYLVVGVGLLLIFVIIIIIIILFYFTYYVLY